MEYANDDTTDIPEIDLNICVAVQTYHLRDSSIVSTGGTGSDSASGSAESDEECSRPSVKSSKQIIVRCEYSLNWKHYVVRTLKNFWYFLSLYRVVNLPPMKKPRSEQFQILDAVLK